MASFDDRKQTVLQGLASDEKDRSRAGGVDAPIAALIDRINWHPQYFTTSSCSGRISIFSESAPDDNEGKDGSAVGKKTKKKKGGDWVYVSHEMAVESEVLKSVQEYCTTMQDGLLVFRYEPFILALECRTPAAAQHLVTCAISAGFRESGITGMGKRNIVGVRCSIRLEVPIVHAGRMLVTDDYLRFLTALANKKMELNCQRTDAFLIRFIDQVEGQSEQRLSEISEIERSIQNPSNGHLPSELSTNGGFEEMARVNSSGAREFQDHAEKKSAKDKESKKKLSALKGRQLRLLARLSLLENRRLLSIETTSAGQTEHTLRFQDDVCSDTCTVKTLPKRGRGKTTGSVHIAKNGSNHDRSRFASTSVQSGQASQEWEAKLSTSSGRGKSEGCSLPAAHLKVCGEAVELLHCWSHSTVHATNISGRDSLLVYGGFGGPGRHARQGNTLVLDCLTGELKRFETSNARPPRMSHVAVVVGQCMVVIGGRHDPSTCLGDVCVLDLKANCWHFPEVTGSQVLPRHRHAVARVGDNIYIFGGMNQNTVLGDFYVLNKNSWEWKCIDSRGDIPSPRYSHSLAAIGQKLYLFGGRDERRAYGDLYVFCLQTNTWREQKGLGELSSPRFSHSMTAAGKWLVILGGCPITHHGTDLLLLDVEQMTSQRIPLTQAPLDVLLVRHTATLLGTRLVVIGGGAACFAFGAKFNVPFAVDLDLFLDKKGNRNFTESGNEAYIRREEPSTIGGLFAKDGCSDGCEKRAWILRLDRNSAKIGKDALKQLGWLDQTRKAKVLDQGLNVAFPITEEAALYLQDAGSEGMPSSVCRGLNQEMFRELVSKLVATGGEVIEMQLAYDAQRPISPSITLKTTVSKLLQEAGLPQALLEELPKRWERLGDMAILPAGSLLSNSWSSIAPLLWPAIASALGARRIARQAPVAATKTRDSKLQVLYGEGGWVEHRENGILYCFDATKCMFSSGNVSEKLRMASMKCAGEIVVDLFAGIGYYTLPFLLKGGAKLVYSCEWNPNAIEALRHNILVNGVESRCIVLEGDNRITAPKGVSHRVCLGLLPSSEGSWIVAIEALRPEGGILHVHENVKDTSESEWLEYLVSALSKLAAGLDRNWEVKVVHLERVKWYAPHIRHVVADVQCSQR